MNVANLLLRLPKYGGENEAMTGLQGSYRPYTSYSGTTHTGCGVVDMTAYNWGNRLIVLDLLGIDVFHRLPFEGDWPEHCHNVTRGMGCVAASARGQSAAVQSGHNGLTVRGLDRDAHLRSGLWSLAVYNGRTGRLRAKQATHTYDGPSYDRKRLREIEKGFQVDAIMEVNVDGKRWFVTKNGGWGYSNKWEKVPTMTRLFTKPLTSVDYA